MKLKQVPAEIYSRVSGYFRPVQQWNRGKQSEYSERKKAIIKEAPDVGKNSIDHSKCD